jgi:predicted nucleotidyltransferase
MKLDEYGYKNPEEWIKGIYLIGSEVTNLFDKDSDLDIQIVVDKDMFGKYND